MFIGPRMKSTPLKLDIPQLEFLAAITSPTPENEYTEDQTPYPFNASFNFYKNYSPMLHYIKRRL